MNDTIALENTAVIFGKNICIYTHRVLYDPVMHCQKYRKMLTTALLIRDNITNKQIQTL